MSLSALSPYIVFLNEIETNVYVGKLHAWHIMQNYHISIRLADSREVLVGAFESCFHFPSKKNLNKAPRNVSEDYTKNQICVDLFI